MNNNLKKIRESCIKANPGIMELKFGCEIDCIDEQISNDYDLIGIGIVFSNDAAVFNGILRYLTSKERTHRKIKLDFIFHNPKLFKILGRPIRLADVLLAMQGNTKSFVGVDINGYFLDCDDEMKEWKILDSQWNLKDDNLDQQSQETIDFIASLL